MYVHTSAGTCRIQEMASDPLELELEVFWFGLPDLGAGSSTWAVCALKHQGNSPAPIHLFSTALTILRFLTSFSSIFCGCLACMLAWGLWRPEEGVGSHETGVTDSGPCAIRRVVGLKPSPREEQPLLLSTEPSLQPLNVVFYTMLEWHFIKYCFVGKHLELTGL